jgi:hypothetical protein
MNDKCVKKVKFLALHSTAFENREIKTMAKPYVRQKSVEDRTLWLDRAGL